MSVTALFTAEKLAAMGKEELRQACRDLHVSYAKLNNDGMRELLLRTAVQSETTEEAAVEPAAAPHPLFAGLVGTQPEVKHTRRGATKVVDGKKQAQDGNDPRTLSNCPKCGSKELYNGHAPDGVVIDEEHAGGCHDCDWTYDVRRKQAPAPRMSRKGYNIDKVREERNGVKRRSAGTVCGAIWDEFDRVQERDGVVLASSLTEMALTNGWNKTNVQCEFYAWRKFNGISGRVVAPN